MFRCQNFGEFQINFGCSRPICLDSWSNLVRNWLETGAIWSTQPKLAEPSQIWYHLVNSALNCSKNWLKIGQKLVKNSKLMKIWELAVEGFFIWELWGWKWEVTWRRLSTPPINYCGCNRQHPYAGMHPHRPQLEIWLLPLLNNQFFQFHFSTDLSTKINTNFNQTHN